jgi:pimeloyl-ACP methyl ester carboxylesterase
MSEVRDVDAAPVAWREAGSGPPVLFLAGLGLTRTGFDPQLAALGSRYRCVAWDMPGYGASPLPAQGISFPLLADAAAGLIEALGEKHAHLAGLSLGAQVALHTALRHPARVRSLALLDSSPAFGLDGTDPEAWKRLRLAALDAGETPASIAEAVLRSVMATGVDDGAVAAAVASMQRISAAGLRAAIECLPSHDVRARLGEIAVPTLVLVGEHDQETPLSYAEALAAGIQGARLQIIPGAGHVSNLEAPEAVNIALREHLDAAEAAA